ncbi:hypothetical protein K2173_006489 [Erythroxylum novogranatense]|uniref:60S ribosomal protein L21 n=1 Tax=Erythroxylum novogranatense TaxID=1862640 RepID=A0AAV8SKA7_9ROSI|nr:hypothetical protein K2173_006489 [Erythroxylum novogranatense]
MPAGRGLCSRTSDLFARPFRKKGYIPLTTYVNGAVHKGMPHKFYHGSTGRVWNVGNRIIKKRIHVRVEHLQPSRCTEEFQLRKKRRRFSKEESLKGIHFCLPLTKGRKALG